MQPFISLTSTLCPVPRKDIDTDIIIAADFLKVTTKEGLGKHVFDRVRKEKDIDFSLVDKRKSSRILVARDNFGCGSSREHAVWALMDWGYQVIIAPSFANIFYGNALNNGLLPIALPEDVVENLIYKSQEDASFEIAIDLEKQKVIIEEGVYDFEIDSYKKTCLLNGMGDLDYLLSHQDQIKSFDQEHQKNLFFDISKI